MSDITTSEIAAKKLYPNENFISSTLKLQSLNRFTKDMEMPQNVYLAESRIPRTKGDADKLRKELRQADILARYGKVIYLTPEPGRYRECSYDAIVDGVPYEFRNITGNTKKIERKLSEAKSKSKDMNVFMNIDSNIDIDEVIRRIKQVLDRHPEYSGKIIVSLKGNMTYFWDTIDFR
jgi:hypothetical protein